MIETVKYIGCERKWSQYTSNLLTGTSFHTLPHGNFKEGLPEAIGSGADVSGAERGIEAGRAIFPPVRSLEEAEGEVTPPRLYKGSPGGVWRPGHQDR